MMRNFTFILMLINGFNAIILLIQNNYMYMGFSLVFMFFNYFLFLCYCKIDEIEEAKQNKKK